MRFGRRMALVLLMLPTLLVAQARKKHTVSAAFNNARFAWVETIDGSDAFSPAIIPEDRQAIEDVQDALNDWKRYALATHRSDAELIFVLRKGRIAAANIGGTAGGGSVQLGHPAPGQRQSSRPGISGLGISAGGEAGSPDDLLQVRMLNPDGTLGTVIWEHLLPGGLNAPQVALVAQLRNAVEHDYPQNAPPQP